MPLLVVAVLITILWIDISTGIYLGIGLTGVLIPYLLMDKHAIANVLKSSKSASSTSVSQTSNSAQITG